MNRSEQKTRMLTETAAAAAIASILVLLKLLLPVLVFITMITAAAPIAVIGYFHGIRWSLGASLSVILLVTIIGGPEIGLTTAVYAGALGVTLGVGYRQRWSSGKILCLTALAYIVEMSYKIIFSIYILGLTDVLSSVLSRFIQLIRWIWVPAATWAGVNPDPGQAMYSGIGAAMVAVVFAANAFAYAYLNMGVCDELIKRLRMVSRWT